ncbi:Oidioi.mRNA.OKI2018_I69.chr1.g2074.t1.cds [Oikopleura dioica]|uniref:AP complex subunit sigma n=1 Tax=Oikopleura dioica TaxID=34765 RepID=A0ABN7SQH3_OIKDI|nr:Oidioi.mRNA.OKI2018_I69.chr1.g2074.t1.cds [Oikopleura dioica]
MFHAVLVFNKQSKMRLQKWYSCEVDRERFTKSIVDLVCNRDKSYSSIVEFFGYKIVYKKFASLFFALCIDMDDNEFDALNIIRLFVEMLDSQFGSVCEVDMIFEFERSYQILDEIILAGHLQESSKKEIARELHESDLWDEERAVLEHLKELGMI